jgi:hypothetical protein
MLSKKQKHSSHGSHGKKPEPSSDPESSLCGGARYGPIAEAHLEKESRAKEDINE